jgi:hypothetical protein
MAEKYDNPTKETWRGWAWNEIARRGVMPGENVMVLCGEHGGDIDHARRRGLNVIGVDVNQGCVENFRTKGGIAVRDKLHRQVILQKPSALIADMLGGLTPSSFADVILLSPILTALVWNGLRGRDEGIGQIAEANHGKAVPVYKNGRFAGKTLIERHRGKIGFVSYCCWVGQFMCESDGNSVEDRFIDEVAKIARPSYYTYRTTESENATIYYDSLAMTMFDTRSRMLESTSIDLVDSLRCKKSRRKAAAAKALLTMRRNRN